MYDKHAAHLYNPEEYSNHGSGLFFMGVEATGMIFAYALDHVGGGYQRIASIVSGQTGIMGLEFDRDIGALWAYCDDTCGNRATVLDVEDNTASPSWGHFVVRRAFDRPASMPNLNNEGIAIAPESECVAGLKSFFWTDDAETDGHSIRRGELTCGPLF